MKKFMIFLLIATLMVVPTMCFAQSREASGATLSQTRTNLTALALMGQNVVGNPGFLAMTAPAASASSYVPEYYLWIKSDGDLCIASGPTLENYSTFPDGNWITEIEAHCTVVGSQS